VQVSALGSSFAVAFDVEVADDLRGFFVSVPALGSVRAALRSFKKFARDVFIMVELAEFALVTRQAFKGFFARNKL